MNNKTWTSEIVQRVKDEALNLEGAYTSRDEYIAAMDELIAYFSQSKKNAIENTD